MLRARLLRSTAFRLAISFGLVFVIAFVVTGFITYRLQKQDLERQLNASLTEAYAVIASSYEHEELEDLIITVDTYSRLNDINERIFSVIDTDGRKIAGNFYGKGLPDGISDVLPEKIGLTGDVNYRVIAGTVDGRRLIVGQSFRQTKRLEDVISRSFALATAVVVGLAVIGGMMLAARVQRRLDAIAGAMTAVSHGELDVRVPIKGNGDDIDTVSSQINQAIDRLAALVEAMRQVSSDIAHELKTPLNRLKMQIETAVGNEERGKPVAAALTEARNEADQINATFEALLRISQIEAGARKSRFQRVDLFALMASVAEVYVDVAEDSGMLLTTVMEGAAGLTVDGDRELLTQMFVNLVENAIRHCAAGTRIVMSLERADGEAVAAVSDNGTGIPDGEREKVLRRLYRLDKSRSTAGSGLGLSLVRAVADLHGGRIVLGDNNPGLRATVLLPIPTS